jgi:hypothetical protein
MRPNQGGCNECINNDICVMSKNNFIEVPVGKVH